MVVAPHESPASNPIMSPVKVRLELLTGAIPDRNATQIPEKVIAIPNHCGVHSRSSDLKTVAL